IDWHTTSITWPFWRRIARRFSVSSVRGLGTLFPIERLAARPPRRGRPYFICRMLGSHLADETDVGSGDHPARLLSRPCRGCRHSHEGSPRSSDSIPPELVYGR